MAKNSFRNWFLTVHPSAACFDDIHRICSKQSNCTYAIIAHTEDDLDFNEDGTINNDGHYHVVLIYDNARTFSAIQNHFKGANIKECISVVQSVRYLTHIDHPEKHPYKFENIVSNNIDIIKDLYNNKTYPKLDEHIILTTIMEATREDKLITLPYFYIVYGNDQVKKYRQMIIDCLRDYESVKQLYLYEDTESVDVQEPQN